MSGSPIHLALLWHMHQPWYVDPARGRPALPWVRLHGASSYTDAAALLEQHPEIRVTVCLSPSLLDQIGIYARGDRDAYEELTLHPAEQLRDGQRAQLVRHFFSLHWEHAIARFPAYGELLERRGREVPPQSWDEVAARFEPRQLRDLQLLFNLAWLGQTARQEPRVAALERAGSGFAEEDKAVVLDRQRELLGQLQGRWSALVAAGAVEPCATAYYHPVLPLLVDSNSARRANPEVALPERFAFPEDAAAQLTRGWARVEQALGRAPGGIWLPEGAISPEVVQLAERELNPAYVVADGDLLFHSLDDRGSTPGATRLFQPYRVGGTTVLFRDKRLSERLTGEYAGWSDADAAAADFVQHVRQAGDRARVDGDGPPLVLVAADGENPWEAYPDRGLEFLAAVYRAVARDERIRAVTIGEHLDRHPAQVGLEYLHSGSRIETTFDVWIGDPDKNRAWNLLTRARERLARARRGGEADDARLRGAAEHLLRAQASDWFWWLGEPFSSVEDHRYEALFRGHLRALYQALGDSPPADLSRPIQRGGIVEPLRQPSALIHPRIDGSRTSFFEWRGAGFFRAPAAGSLSQPHSFIAGLYWGFDPARLYVRLDPVDIGHQRSARVLDELEIWLELTTGELSLRAQLRLSGRPAVALSVTRGGAAPEDLGQIEEVAYRDVLELALPLPRLGLQPGTRLGLSVHFARAGEVLSVVPGRGVIEVEIPRGGELE